MTATPLVDPNDAAESAGDRTLGTGMTKTARSIAVAYALFHVYTAGFGNFPSLIQRSTHVGFALVLVFMLYSARGKGGRTPSYLDWVFVAVSLAATAWVSLNFDRFMARQALTAIDIALGTMLIITVLEAARRVIGPSFTILAVCALAYAFWGRLVPMPFTHRGFDLSVVVNHLYTSDLGLWGTTTSVTASVVSIFIVFGTVLLLTGGAKTFMDLALVLAGRSIGGPAKVATIASSLFGTVSGSAVANVAVTGNFTIPMMRRLNYDRHFAAAVEATASTGGQLMPPLMGAGAFIMAELLGLPYVDIMLAATIPALLFYLGVFVAIHQGSKVRGYSALPRDQIPSLREALRWQATLPLVAAIAVLLYLLMSGSSPQRAGFMGTMVASVIYLVGNFRLSGFKGRMLMLLKALETSGYALILIAVLAATAQILIGIIGLSGIGVRFTSILISITSGDMALGLVISMVVALILGMGMPTTGAYLIAASVLAPALIRLGTEDLAAHLFIFYFAIISAITPPVCAAVFVAAGIAQAKWFKTALIATQMGLVAFLIPFMFVNTPGLLMQGNVSTILWTTFSAAIGVIALASAVMGHFLRPSRIWESALLLLGALMLIKPGSWTDSMGLITVAAVVALQYFSFLQPNQEGSHDGARPTDR
tara:strand:- start:18405 stop:20360 length:1956 start_codon:yes stop_codon:yes gene_type:complete